MKTQVSDAGCAALASALNGGALQALEDLDLARIPASAAAKAAVGRAGLDGWTQGWTCRCDVRARCASPRFACTCIAHRRVSNGRPFLIARRVSRMVIITPWGETCMPPR
jgi:hypothetical protein